MRNKANRGPNVAAVTAALLLLSQLWTGPTKLEAQSIEELMNIPQPVPMEPADLYSIEQLMGVDKYVGVAEQKEKGDEAEIEVNQVTHPQNAGYTIEDLMNIPQSAALGVGRGIGGGTDKLRLQRNVVANRGLTLPQPTEPRSLILAANPGSFTASGIALGRLRAYILNTARGGTNPDFVDFLNLETRSYDVRVDISGDFQAFIEPQTMEITDDAGTLVIAVRGSDPRIDPSPIVPSHLTIVDTRTASLVRRINLPDRHWPAGLALSPDGRVAYVSTQERSQNLESVIGFPVLIMDLTSGALVGRVELPFGGSGTPGEVVITPDGALLFVLSARQFSSATSSPGVYVIDTRTSTIIAAIGGTNPDSGARRAVRTASQLAMHPSGSKVFVSPTLVADTFDQYGFGVIDTGTGTLVANVSVPAMRQDSELSDLTVTSDGKILVVYDNLSGHVSYFDALTYELVVQETVTPFANRGALSKGP